MFKSPFSFQGRIRRTEFGVSILIYALCYAVIVGITSSQSSGMGGTAILFIPMLWFLWAQGAKRCHDLGKSGIWQIVPFYCLWMLFQDGQVYENEYGSNPKRMDLNQYIATQQDAYVVHPNNDDSESSPMDKRIDLTKK
jgi:uncharacterized membrane protein YhaH (DUF805 family)